MLYHVRARPRNEEMGRFRDLLNNRTIQKQEPDGREIIASMKRAVINGDMVERYETCYCNPPLLHERSTVYDQFFEEMKIETTDSSIRLSRPRFWNSLSDSKTAQRSIAKDTIPTRTQHVPIRIL